MMRIPICIFDTIEDVFNFGRYRELSLADVLDINPTYLDWCVKCCTGVIFVVNDNVIEQMHVAYPYFPFDNLFENQRLYNMQRYDNYLSQDEADDYYEDVDYNEPPTYERYSGSWAQDEAGYSDDDIDTIFDGDPSAYWNID